MKDDVLRFSSKRILFSAMFASVLWGGFSHPLYAENAEAYTVMQGVRVQGVVLDATGEPVIGASILEKGTSNGVITDLDGKFSLNVASSKSVIVISYIGFKTKEVSASDKNLQKIVLSEDTEVLDEVVVIGYGAQKKETLTGSVAVVGSDIFKDKGTVSNPLQAMQYIFLSHYSINDNIWFILFRNISIFINNYSNFILCNNFLCLLITIY